VGGQGAVAVRTLAYSYVGERRPDGSRIRDGDIEVNDPYMISGVFSKTWVQQRLTC
jgi:hypothetical protein